MSSIITPLTTFTSKDLRLTIRDNSIVIIRVSKWDIIFDAFFRFFNPKFKEFHRSQNMKERVITHLAQTITKDSLTSFRDDTALQSLKNARKGLNHLKERSNTSNNQKQRIENIIEIIDERITELMPQATRPPSGKKRTYVRHVHTSAPSFHPTSPISTTPHQPQTEEIDIQRRIIQALSSPIFSDLNNLTDDQKRLILNALKYPKHQPLSDFLFKAKRLQDGSFEISITNKKADPLGSEYLKTYKTNNRELEAAFASILNPLSQVMAARKRVLKFS